MENETNTQPTDTKTFFFGKDAVKLACFAFFTTAICVITFLNTREKIEDNINRLTIEKLEEVSPGAAEEFELTDQWIHIMPQHLGLKKPKKAFVIQRKTSNERWVFPITVPDGYGGAIELLMGVSTQGQITGVRVIPPHNETPGLGDKIELKKSDWIKDFDGKSLANTLESDWAIKKEGGAFDTFTGASITPRAVINSVHKGLVFFQQHQGSLENTAYQADFRPQP